jgi:hypothetical protein
MVGRELGPQRKQQRKQSRETAHETGWPFPARVPTERRQTGAAVSRLELARTSSRLPEGQHSGWKEQAVSQGFALYPNKFTHFFFSGCKIGILP